MASAELQFSHGAATAWVGCTITMSWSELERLVELAERHGALRRQLRLCHSSTELVSTARRLGFRINQADLRQARLRHRQAQRRWRRISPSSQPFMTADVCA